jgi:hypothetical protein
MTDDEPSSMGRSTGAGQFLPLLGLFVGALVYSLLPHGAFGAYDVAVRAAMTGAAAASTSLALFVAFKRWGRMSSR